MERLYTDVDNIKIRREILYICHYCTFYIVVYVYKIRKNKRTMGYPKFIKTKSGFCIFVICTLHEYVSEIPQTTFS